MKTIEQFTTEVNKRLQTVQAWIKNGLVNGAKFENGEYIISDQAWPPYTRASKKNAGTIRKGIVIGCKRRLSVNARVFGISDSEFSVYANQLVALDLIEKHEVDGIEYYYSTPKADGLSDSQIYKAMKGLAETVTEAATRAVTEKLLNP